MMKARVLIRSFLIAAMLCVAYGSSFAATWYVKEASNGGNDAAAGTSWATAFATVQQAVNVSAVSGDAILVANGLYAAQIYINEKSVTIEGGYATGTPSQGFTEFRAPTFGTLTSYTDATLLPAAVVGSVIESNTFRPVVYVNTSSNTFNNNISGVTINGNYEYADVPSTSHLFCGLVYRNSNGTVGSAAKPVSVINVRGTVATNPAVSKKASFSVLIFGRSQATFQYVSVSQWHNAAFAVLGNSTSSLASTIALQPLPTILECRVNGTTGLSLANMTSDRAGVIYANGARTYTRRSIFCSVGNAGAGNGYGMFVRDGRAIIFGDLTIKTNGNVITGCEIGVGVRVTTSLINPATEYTIRNNNIVYNGNGASNATATGAAHFRHDPATAGTLNLINNAWGNSAASSLYTTGNNNTFAFWVDTPTGADAINYSGALASMAVISGNAAGTYVGAGCTDLEYGFTHFPSLQEGVNGVATCGTITLNSGTYTENIVINKCLTLNGNPGGDCENKPIIVSANNTLPTITVITPAENVTVDGVRVDKAVGAGANAYGYLSTSNTNNPTGVWPGNPSPRNLIVRNSCFKGFDNETPAAMSTDSDGEAGSGNFSGRTDDNTQYPSERDVDATFNNVLNYLTVVSDIQLILMDRFDTPNPAANNRAQINPPVTFVIPCGSKIQPYIDAASPGATLFIQGACAYVENLNFNKQLYIDVSYTGRPLISPVLHARTDTTPGAHTYSTSSCQVGWWGDPTAVNKPPIRFERAVTPGVPYPNPLVSQFGTLRPNYWVIPNAPTNICLQTAHDSLATGGATMEFTGAGTTNYTVNLTINKLLTLHTPTGGAVRGLNAGQTLQTNPGADVSRTGSGSWDAPLVVVNTSANGLTGNTGTGSIQQGIRLATNCGTVNVNSQTTDGSNYSAQAPIIDQTLTILDGIDNGTPDFPTVTSITLSGSGNCTACAGNPAVIDNFNVPIIYMANLTDCIQTAVGTAGNQDEHGVGNLPATIGGANNARFGTVQFNVAGAVSPVQTVIVDKDVKFLGNAGAVTNNAIMTMRLGARRDNSEPGNSIIDESSNYCHTTVNIEQTPGSGYNQIPEIDDAINLACAGNVVNVGNAAANTNWGSGDTYGAGTDNAYNQETIISKALTVQGRNTPTECANNPAFVIDAASAWGTNAARVNFSRFQNFTPANPIFTLMAGINSIILRGFDFSNITNGAATAMIASPGANNDVTVENNWSNGSTERFLNSATQGTQRSNWFVNCNRFEATANNPDGGSIYLRDHTGLNINRNMMVFTGSASGTDGVILEGVGGATQNWFQRNVVEGARNGGVYLVNSANTTQNINVYRNRIRNNNPNAAANRGGLNLTSVSAFTGAVNVTENFISGNQTGVELNVGAVGGAVNHTFLTVNDNSITGNMVAGLAYPNATGTVTLNARRNWWNHSSGPTNNYNPLNPTVCVFTTFGDNVTNNGTCGTDPLRIGFIPWDVNGVDDQVLADGYQTTNVDLLRRVVRTTAAGVFESHSHTIMGAGALASGAAEGGTLMGNADDLDVITVTQGNPAWSPTYDAAGGDNWGDYFSEVVALDGTADNLLVRGRTTVELAGAVSTTFHTFLAGTGNITAPAAGTAPAVTTNGQGVNGFTIGDDAQIIRNFRIQGYSSATPGSAAPFQGAAIRIPTGKILCRVEQNVINGSNTVGQGSFGVVVEGTGSVTIGSTTIAADGNDFGSTTALSAVNSGDFGGIGVHFDANGGAMAAGGSTVARNNFGGSGSGSTGLEHAAIRFDNTTSLGGTVTIQRNGFRQVRDAAGNGGLAAKSAIYFNNLTSAAGGQVNITENHFGAGYGTGTTVTGEGNKVDILVEGAGTNTGWVLNTWSNTFRAEDQTVDGINYLIQDDRAVGTSGPFLRNVFGFNNGTNINSNSGNNTFSHAAILTSTPSITWDYNVAINRQSPVSTISGTRRIYRQISTPMNAMNVAINDHMVEIRENAAWTLGNLGQYYHEDLAFPVVGGSHDDNYELLLLGPTPANALNTTSAHLISAGTGSAITSTNRQNRDIRGGIVCHAYGNGLYGSIPAAIINRGDVYLQGQAQGTDIGFVQFAYGASFGTQALVAGIGTEVTGGNANADKATIIKAGLNDADDDTKSPTGINNRRTGVFLYGNGTQFTRPLENPTPGLANGELISVYPNPSKGEGTLTVSFVIPTDAYVKMALYNALGQKVAELPSNEVKAGSYTSEVNVTGLPAGTYTVRMDYDLFTAAAQVMIVR